MARLITGRPSTYTINKINRDGGIYRPYGLNGRVPEPSPVDLDIDTLKQCFELQGWTPVKRNAVTLFFPVAGATLTLAQCEACDLDHLPGPLRVDAQACIQAQGGCNG